MKNSTSLESFHKKCVCETCTCKKHRCPTPKVRLPLGEISTYQKEYHQHPISLWKKPPPEKASAYQPYGGICSSYKEFFHPHQLPSSKPRPPVIPAKDLPFESCSEYERQFKKKRVDRPSITIKDRKHAPCHQSFKGETTYKTHYGTKLGNPYRKPTEPDVRIPQNYRFCGQTTYGSSFKEKPITKIENYKPEEKLAPKGTHDLNSIYRQDYLPKPLPHKCPVLSMPKPPKQLPYPSQHAVFNKSTHEWIPNDSIR